LATLFALAAPARPVPVTSRLALAGLVALIALVALAVLTALAALAGPVALPAPAGPVVLAGLVGPSGSSAVAVLFGLVALPGRLALVGAGSVGRAVGLGVADSLAASPPPGRIEPAATVGPRSAGWAVAGA
jgi:hypothetical protein